VPEDDLEMMARFVEEEGLEKDEKVEGVRAMIEGFVDVRLSLLCHSTFVPYWVSEKELMIAVTRQHRPRS
jgi:hypothetical protein